jgi:hypothetical protein
MGDANGGGLTGGCMCGAVRYELGSEPFDCGWCHCRTCQRSGGGPGLVFASVPEGDMVWISGAEAVRTVRSSSFGHRTFCGQCGTPFQMKVEHQPETVDFTVATLDEPGAIAPGFHIFWASRVPWFDPGDHLPRYEGFRPDTRGLEGTEPRSE